MVEQLAKDVEEFFETHYFTKQAGWVERDEHEIKAFRDWKKRKEMRK